MACSRCRLCGSAGLEPIVDLGFHPLADRFLDPSSLLLPEVTYPLTVHLCGECGYAGLDHVVPPEVRYQEAAYSYTAGNSRISRGHFAELAREATAALRLGPRDLAVDVGGNDGTLLLALEAESDCAILNVEPSPNIANLSRAAGVTTIQEFWGRRAALEVARPQLPGAIARGASLIVATNAFNHDGDPCEFVACASMALRPGGSLVIEVPSLRRMVRQGAFDTIYLEHVSYFGLRPLVRMLGELGFGVERAAENDYMGGSIRIYARSGGVAHAPDVLHQVDVEDGEGTYEPEAYQALARGAERTRDDLCERLYRIRRSGGTVVGVGAAAKGNTLLNYCRIHRGIVASVADQSPLKIGKLTPGSHLPIISDAEIPASATHALILPWNIASFLRDKLARPGLEFIVPGGQGEPGNQGAEGAP